jgi:NAD(P)-dependent dehydrogenase (short-subunit alcohol dehydrogenase family)
MADPERSMAGRTCLVTGATSGIGQVTARELARRGATVIVVGRNQQRCLATAGAIRREMRNESVQSLTADLSSQEEVRRLAREFRQRHDRLHVLVNNAGALFALRGESADGIERTLASNHLGPFLLTNLLLETIKASAPARIVNVSSEAHRDVRGFDFDDPQADHAHRWLGADRRSRLAGALYALLLPRHPAFLRYAESKLANLLFTSELARRLAGTGVTANALHPGFVATRFMAGNGVLGWFMRRWAGLLATGAEDGARMSVYLASAPEVEGITGGYFIGQRPVPSSPASRDEAAARRLWRLSEELTAPVRTAPHGDRRRECPFT